MLLDRAVAYAARCLYRGMWLYGGIPQDTPVICAHAACCSAEINVAHDKTIGVDQLCVAACNLLHCWRDALARNRPWLCLQVSGLRSWFGYSGSWPLSSDSRDVTLRHAGVSGIRVCDGDDAKIASTENKPSQYLYRNGKSVN